MLFLLSRESLQNCTVNKIYSFYSQSQEITLKLPTMLLRIPMNLLEQPFIMEIRNRVMQITRTF